MKLTLLKCFGGPFIVITGQAGKKKDAVGINGNAFTLLNNYEVDFIHELKKTENKIAASFNL